MSAFSFHNEDGRITSSHKLYDPEGYDKILNERGIAFHQHKGRSDRGYADLDRHWINQSGGTKEMSVRPRTGIFLSKTTIKAGEMDAARLWNALPGSTIDMSIGGYALPQVIVPQRGPVYLSSPVPGIYSIFVRKWPYQEWHGQLEAV